MAFAATSPINIIAMAGFIISAMTYLTHAFGSHDSVTILIGMSVITLGYILLFTSKLMAYIEERRKGHAKKTDAVTLDEGQNPKQDAWKSKLIVQYFGYAILAIFFIGTFFRREFTIHYRFYDIFGGIGYSLMMFTKYIPVFLPITFIILYYFFGGIIKISEEGFVNKAQLVARAMLFAYYAATLMSALHLF